MKTPMPPPDLGDLTKRLTEASPAKFLQLLLSGMSKPVPLDPYLPWDQLRYKNPPDELSTDEWWFLTKIRRNNVSRKIPLKEVKGEYFSYALTDEVFRTIEDINRHLSGSIGIGEKVANAANRDSYLVSSLIEESITSSQLEGAITTRAVAKEMIRTGRPPVNRYERMILNNYSAMRRIGELRDEEVSIEVLQEIQRIVTDGTMADPTAAGRFQLPTEQRVGVYDHEDNLLHAPPPAEMIEPMVRDLCDFVNAPIDSEVYVPPVIRAIVAHFMIGYIHPFEDGNGRTARALFYWVMLRNDYWLTEFISISRILNKAPAQYGRSYLNTEQDDNDLTYFILYQLNVIKRATSDLRIYLERKVKEAREFQRAVAATPGEFNYRQVALLQNAIRRPDAIYTVLSHATSHDVGRETARQDLLNLEDRGFLQRIAAGRKFSWQPTSNLQEKLQRA